MDINERLKAMSVSGKYGAPMGRHEHVDNETATVVIQRVIFQDGDYDLGGAYWGGGTPLFCAMDEDGEVCTFIRADNITQARKLLLQDWPDLTIQGGIDVVEATNGFLRAVLFAECDVNSEDEDDDSSLEQLNYGLDDFSPEALAKARDEVGQFIDQITEAGLDTSAWEDDEIGMNFYFDRSGHGCGFTDKNEKDSRQLKKMAQTWGSIYCWVAKDDGSEFGLINWE